MSPAEDRAAGAVDDPVTMQHIVALRRARTLYGLRNPESVEVTGFDFERDARNLILRIAERGWLPPPTRPAPPDDGALAEAWEDAGRLRATNRDLHRRAQKAEGKLARSERRFYLSLSARDRTARFAAETALAEARDVLAPFARYAEQHRYLDNAEGEIGEFYGPAFRVSISYAALRAVRDYARRLAAQFDPSGTAGAAGGGGEHGL